MVSGNYGILQQAVVQYTLLNCREVTGVVIGIIGESCTGKSTVAEELAKRLDAKVFTGKEYMKQAKSEAEAKKAFAELLCANEESGEHYIYVITEPEHIAFLPPKAFRILMTAELDVIKERFAQRLNTALPPPVAAMLESKHGMFDGIKHDLKIENAGKSISEVCDSIVKTVSVNT